MKKMILAIVAMMSITAAMAQGNNRPQRNGNQQFDRTEMIKQRTDNAVQKYGLNTDQAAKLLELNTKYADTMGPGMGMGGRRGGGQGGGMRPRPNFGGGNGQGAQQGQRPEMTEEMRAQMEKARKDREEAQKKYEEELKTIMTPDQYKAYQADQEEMRRNFGNRRGGGQRRGNQNQQ
jgi:hypothetical protein